MKRYISIFLIISLCFSFASCSVKEETPDITAAATTQEATTSEPPPLTVTEEYSRDFTDENGRVVYTVRALLPKITGNTEESVAEDINRSVYGIFEDACETAESNVENAAAFMDANNSETPWARSFEYEINLCTDKYFSITVNEYFTMFGSSEIEPIKTGYTFNVVRGRRCALGDFTYENYLHEGVKRVIVDEFIGKDVAKVYFDGAELTEEQRATVYDAVDTENFYLTDSGIGFYFSENAIDFRSFGTFVTHYTWQEIAVILKRP